MKHILDILITEYNKVNPSYLFAYGKYGLLLIHYKQYNGMCINFITENVNYVTEIGTIGGGRYRGYNIIVDNAYIIPTFLIYNEYIANIRNLKIDEILND